MSHSDPISDLLTRIRNSTRATHRYVDVNLSKMNLAIIEVLKKNRYIANFLVDEEKRVVRIFLRYSQPESKSVIQGIKRISKPSVRKYVGYNDIPYVLSGLGTALLSTPKGVVDGAHAKQLKVGGELLCTVW